jgi:hypothetical protein
MAGEHPLIGKQGRVTGRIAHGTVGEVILSHGQGTNTYHALPADPEASYTVGVIVEVVAFSPPQTVYVKGLIMGR